MDRRARLHRALDTVIDRSTRARDTEVVKDGFTAKAGKEAAMASLGGFAALAASQVVRYKGWVIGQEGGYTTFFKPNGDVTECGVAGSIKQAKELIDRRESGIVHKPPAAPIKDATYTAPNHAFTFGKYKGELIKGICAKCGRPLTDDIHSSKEDLERYAKMKDAAQYEVRKSRSNDAWAVFKIGDDFPVTSWTNSKAAAMIDARRLNGGTVKVRPKSQETAAREVAKRTELNPVVRNYFKLDQ